jgi:ribosomal protein L7/L12
MAEAPEPRGEFKFVLNSVRPEAAQAVAQELTRLFPLDLPNATSIIGNAPIILIDGLTPQQARCVGTYALRLKALGADVQVTGQPVGKLRVLRWPLLPEIAKRPGNHVICPNCGARLKMEVYVQAAVEAAPQPAAPERAAEAPPGPPEPSAVEQAPPGPPPEPPEVMPQPSSPASPATAAGDLLEPIELDGDDFGDDFVELSDEEVTLEAPPQISPAPPAAPAASPPAAPPQPAPPPSAPPQPAAPARPAPPAGDGGVGGDGSIRVTLVGKVRGQKKLDAAELMQYYLGVSQSEAVSQLAKTVVTVARDLTEEQAEECQERFAEIGVKVKLKGG